MLMRRFLDFFVFEMCCSGVWFRMAAVLATLGALRLDGALQRSGAMPRWSLPRQRAATISPSLQPREPPREPNSIPRFRHRRSCSISAHSFFPRVSHAPKSLRNLSAPAHGHDPQRFAVCAVYSLDTRRAVPEVPADPGDSLRRF